MAQQLIALAVLLENSVSILSIYTIAHILNSNSRVCNTLLWYIDILVGKMSIGIKHKIKKLKHL